MYSVYVSILRQPVTAQSNNTVLADITCNITQTRTSMVRYNIISQTLLYVACPGLNCSALLHDTGVVQYTIRVRNKQRTLVIAVRIPFH